MVGAIAPGPRPRLPPRLRPRRPRRRRRRFSGRPSDAGKRRL